MAIWRRCVQFFRPDVRADVDDELRFHLEARIAEYEARGYSRAEAARLARDRFGDPEPVRRVLESHDFARQRRETRREHVSQILQDARIALRSLRRTPAFTLTVLATLALGIGANAAVFSVVSRELIDPLPYQHADRLVMLSSASARESALFVAPAVIEQLQHSSRSLASVAAFGWYTGYTYVDQQRTLSWRGVSASPNFFRTLGVRPALGRLIDDRDVDGRPAKVVVLSHDLWSEAFNADPGVVGKTIRVNDAAWTVIGVLRPDFVSPSPARVPQIWTPLDVRQFLTGQRAHAPFLQSVARLTDAATFAQTQAEVRIFGEREAAGAPTPFSIAAVPIRDAMVGDVRPMLLVIMGAALLVLTLAAVNVAGLFLSRATARGREMAVRAALGASRWRIIRELVTETMLLGIAGGGLGVLLAYWSRAALAQIDPHVLPPTGAPPSIDAPVLTFVCIVSIVIGLASGVVSALLARRDGLRTALAEGNRGATSGRTSVRAGRVLVAGQMALAIVLLVGAGLLGRTLFALQRVDLGFDTSSHVLSVFLALPRSYSTPDAQSQFFTEWLARMRRLPGVEAAGFIGVSPWNGWNHEPVHVEHGPDGAAITIDAPLGVASDGYFDAAGTAIRSGRPFSASDRAGALPVAIVSERFARLAWSGRNPIGERIRAGGAQGEWRTVVGVAADVRESATSEIDAGVYVPAWQLPQGGYEGLVRTSGDAHTLLPAIRSEVRAIDPALPVLAPRTLDEVPGASLNGTRLPVILAGAFALLALVLAVLGIYGIVAYSVALRTRELGIRAALGGKRGDIVRLVVSEGLRIAIVGTAIGAVLAAIGARLLTKVLYGVTAHDPGTFALAVLLLLGASAAACLVPAGRATRINPVEALRSE